MSVSRVSIPLLLLLILQLLLRLDCLQTPKDPTQSETCAMKVSHDSGREFTSLCLGNDTA